MIPVKIPNQLHAYTGQQSLVQAKGQTLNEVLDDLDDQFPGLRFRIIDEQNRIREHIRIFLNGTLTTGLETPVGATDELHIIGALSGG